LPLRLWFQSGGLVEIQEGAGGAVEWGELADQAIAADDQMDAHFSGRLYSQATDPAESSRLAVSYSTRPPAQWCRQGSAWGARGRWLSAGARPRRRKGGSRSHDRQLNGSLSSRHHWNARIEDGADGAMISPSSWR
jgi:hypothetical protein